LDRVGYGGVEEKEIGSTLAYFCCLFIATLVRFVPSFDLAGSIWHSTWRSLSFWKEREKVKQWMNEWALDG
jgi:hypothetical protein